MAKRRAKGEGGIYQRHDHPSCPPLMQVGVDDDGKPVVERAEHRCQGRWVAQVDLGWVAGKRKRKTIYGPTKTAVQAQLRRALRDRDTGTLVVKSPTVEAWMSHWLDVICVDRGLKVNTLKSHRSKVERYIIPNLGRHRVDRLQPEHIRAMYAAMRNAGLSEATLRQTHAILHRALKVAVREGKTPRNVAEVVDPPKTKTNHRIGLTRDQARAVLAVASRDGGGLRWYLALYLGMRQGEVLALRWADVNLDEGWLRVERNLVRHPGVGLVFDTPKSAASQREIPVPPVVLSRLKVAWAEHLARGGTADELVFTHAGRPIDHRADWESWRELLATAGVPHVALHAARNTTASLLEAVGVPERMVAQILGQSTIQVTRGYQHAEFDRLRGAMHSLEAYVEQAGRQPPSLP